MGCKLTCMRHEQKIIKSFSTRKASDLVGSETVIIIGLSSGQTLQIDVHLCAGVEDISPQAGCAITEDSGAPTRVGETVKMSTTLG